MTLRLWIEPEAPASERACCSPESVIAARRPATRAASRMSRSMLARPFASQSSVHSSRATRGGRRRIPVPAATEAFASRSCSRSHAAPEPRGSQPATTRASSSIAAGGAWPALPIRNRTSRTCSPASIHAISASSGSRWANSRRRKQGLKPSVPGSRSLVVPRARRRAFWAGATTETSSSGTGFRLGRADRERGGRDGWRPRRLLAVHSRSATRSRRVHGAAELRASERPGDEHCGRWPSRGARSPHSRGLRQAVRRGDEGRREAPLPLAGAAPDVEQTPEGFQLHFDEPAYGVATGQTAVVYEGDAVVGSGTIASCAP